MFKQLQYSLSKLDIRVLHIGIISSFTVLCILLYQIFNVHEVLISDLAIYQVWSYKLLSNVEPHQLPGFPALISLFRLLTFSQINDIYLMQIITLLSWITLFYYSSKILSLLAPRAKNLGLLFFLLFPFFGISFIAYPLADLPAHAVFSAIIYYFISSDRTKLVLFIVISSFLHKVFWPYLMLLLFLSVYQKKINFFVCLCCFLPISCYYLTIFILNGYTDFESLGVLRNFTSDMTLSSMSSFYPFRGVIEGLSSGHIPTISKALMIIGIFISSFFLLIYSIKENNLLFITLILPTLGLCIVIGEFTSGAVIRHAKFLIIPLSYYLCNISFNIEKFERRFFFYLAFLLVFTQFIFTWYNFNYRAFPL